MTVYLRNNFAKYFSHIQDKSNSGLLVFDWLTNINLFSLLTRSASFSHKNHVPIQEGFRDVMFLILTQLQHTTFKNNEYATINLARY